MSSLFHPTAINQARAHKFRPVTSSQLIRSVARSVVLEKRVAAKLYIVDGAKVSRAARAKSLSRVWSVPIRYQITKAHTGALFQPRTRATRYCDAATWQCGQIRPLQLQRRHSSVSSVLAPSLQQLQLPVLPVSICSELCCAAGPTVHPHLDQLGPDRFDRATACERQMMLGICADELIYVRALLAARKRDYEPLRSVPQLPPRCFITKLTRCYSSLERVSLTVELALIFIHVKGSRATRYQLFAQAHLIIFAPNA